MENIGDKNNECEKDTTDYKLLYVQLQEENKTLKKTILSLGKIVKENKEKWKYLEGRFVKVDCCSDDLKTECPLYPLDCQGDNCNSFIDLVELLDKACNKMDIK